MYNHDINWETFKKIGLQNVKMLYIEDSHISISIFVWGLWILRIKASLLVSKFLVRASYGVRIPLPTCSLATGTLVYENGVAAQPPVKFSEDYDLFGSVVQPRLSSVSSSVTAAARFSSFFRRMGRLWFGFCNCRFTCLLVHRLNGG